MINNDNEGVIWDGAYDKGALYQLLNLDTWPVDYDFNNLNELVINDSLNFWNYVLT